MVRVAKSKMRSVRRTESVSRKPAKSASSSSVDSAKLEGYIGPAQRVAEGQFPRRAKTRAVASIAQWYKEHPKGVDQSTTSASSARATLDHALFVASNSDSSEDHTWVSTGSRSRTSSPSVSHSSRSSGGSRAGDQRTSSRPSTSHKKHSAKGTWTADKKIVSGPPSQPTVASMQGDKGEPSSTAEKPKKTGKLVARAMKSDSDSDEDERASSRSVSRAASPSLSSSSSARAVTRSSAKGKNSKTVKLVASKSTKKTIKTIKSKKRETRIVRKKPAAKVSPKTRPCQTCTSNTSPTSAYSAYDSEALLPSTDHHAVQHANKVA